MCIPNAASPQLPAAPTGVTPYYPACAAAPGRTAACLQTRPGGNTMSNGNGSQEGKVAGTKHDSTGQRPRSWKSGGGSNGSMDSGERPAGACIGHAPTQVDLHLQLCAQGSHGPMHRGGQCSRRGPHAAAGEEVLRRSGVAGRGGHTGARSSSKAGGQAPVHPDQWACTLLQCAGVMLRSAVRSTA